jgi:adenosylhomocysteine nucleosidase
MSDRQPASEERAGFRTPAPAPVSSDIGIVAAMPMEVGYIVDRLRRVRKYAGLGHTVLEGEFRDRLVALIVGGMGRTAARVATELLLDGHRPRWIVSAGFAGALDPALRRNDAVMPHEILDLDGQRFAIDVTVAPTEQSRVPKLATGRLLTVDSIIRTAAEKAALRAQFQADLVDMESAAVADVCGARGVRLLAIRVVSDEANVDLPRELATLMSRSGGYRVGAALRSIWKRPSSLKDFWSLHSQALEAADRLADVALAAIERLPL